MDEEHTVAAVTETINPCVGVQRSLDRIRVWISRDHIHGLAAKLAVTQARQFSNDGLQICDDIEGEEVT